MDVDMAATIAWCLMGTVMVGMALMYGCMHRLLSQAYEQGRQDSLSPGRGAASAFGDAPRDELPPTSPQPQATSAA